MAFAETLTTQLQPLADFFASFDLPAPVVRWGHPLMMGIVALVMGSYVGLSGWRGRELATVDGEAAAKSRLDHRKLAPWMTVFMIMGYSGGILSLVMQHHAILASPHFWTGTAVLGLLGLNGLISLTGFGGGALRGLHAYVGSIALCAVFLHGLFGLKLGLSL
ncbi:MAG: hypothetical protein OHK0012_28260 [Synechococcales cyanobacterium]